MIPNNKIIIISEICGQWGGDIKRAERMMLQSKLAGADFVKVQLWDTYEMPGENREKWEYLQMSPSQFDHLVKFGKTIGMPIFASTFNDGLHNFTKSRTHINKIASMLLDFNPGLAKKIAEDKRYHVMCSLGKWEGEGFPFDNPDIIYMHCLAKYPHWYDEAIENMPVKFEGQLKGYSCHAVGIGACEEAIRRGATVIEKHFTTDKTLNCETEGAHCCSMEMHELKELRDYADKFMQSKRNK